MSRRRTSRPATRSSGKRSGRTPVARDARASRSRAWLSSGMLASGAALLVFAVGAFVLGMTDGLNGWLPGSGGGTAQGERPASAVDATGRLLVTFDAGLSLVTLPDRTVRQLVAPGNPGAVQGVRWSPDGQQAAYAWYHIRPDDPPGTPSVEVFLTDLNGQARRLIERDRPGSAVEAPTWSPDGRSLFYVRGGLEDGRWVQRVERLDLATGARTAITDGNAPDVSPDGTLMALVRTGREGYTVEVVGTDGRPVRSIAPPARTSLIGQPRFSPDGRTLAVPMATPIGQAREPSPSSPFGMLAPSVALAHGDPSDLYLVDVAGGDPRRLTRLEEDEPSVAWSPDGTQLAMYALRGLYLVGLDGRTTYAMDRGGYGAIDWSP